MSWQTQGNAKYFLAWLGTSCTFSFEWDLKLWNKVLLNRFSVLQTIKLMVCFSMPWMLPRQCLRPGGFFFLKNLFHRTFLKSLIPHKQNVQQLVKSSNNFKNKDLAAIFFVEIPYTFQAAMLDWGIVKTI